MRRRRLLSPLRGLPDVPMRRFASAFGALAIVFGVLAVFAPTPAQARPCVIRCYDAVGCVVCCPAKGGWVCS